MKVGKRGEQCRCYDIMKDYPNEFLFEESICQHCHANIHYLQDNQDLLVQMAKYWHSQYAQPLPDEPNRSTWGFCPAGEDTDHEPMDALSLMALRRLANVNNT